MLNGILIILLGTLFSGGIAYLGNQFGRYVGRKKMSIFHLRPRYTSIVITVLTGMMIFLFTSLLAVWISKPVKTRLFEMETLQKKEQELIENINKKNEMLLHTSFVFNVLEPIVIGRVKCGLSISATKEQLEILLSQANYYAIEKSNLWAASRSLKDKIPADEKLVGYFPDEYRDLQEKLSRSRGFTGVMLFSNWNAPFKEKVGVNFHVFEIKKIFSDGEIVLKQKINGKDSADKVLLNLMELLKKLQATAEEKGMLSNPQNNTMFEMSLQQLFAKRIEIMTYGKMVKVKLVAKRDIFNIDPLDVRMEVEPW